MKTKIQLAKDIVEQWDKHDKYRMSEGDKALFNDGIEPDEVSVCRYFLKLLDDLKDEFKKFEAVTDEMRDKMDDSDNFSFFNGKSCAYFHCADIIRIVQES